MCGRFYLFPPARPSPTCSTWPAPSRSRRATTSPRRNPSPSCASANTAASLPAPLGAYSRMGEGRQVRADQRPCETAAEKPTFRHAMRKRRCLIPSNGFYEWMRQGKAKQPFCFRLLEDRPFAFAGLWDRWEGPSGPVETCCILTTEANELVRPAHDRMPVMLERTNFEQWLDPAEQDPEALAWMLRPYRADAMRAYPVSPLVNSPKNDNARCLELAYLLRG